MPTKRGPAVPWVETRGEAYERLKVEAMVKPKPPTWGRRPHKHYDGRQVRAANPPGSAILWPFPRYPKKWIPEFTEVLHVQPAENSGVEVVDDMNASILTLIRRIHASREKLYLRKGFVPRDLNAYAVVTEGMWTRVDLWLEQVEALCAAVVDLGHEAPEIPNAFYTRF
ncbi:unnamed protein product [Urochloa humidicola]